MEGFVGTNKSYKRYLVIALMSGLFLLRFPLLIIVSFVPINVGKNVIFVLFMNGTYLLTSLLLILERKRLAELKFNLFAVIIFVLAPIVRIFAYQELRITTPFWDLWFPAGMSILMGVFCVFQYKRLQRDNAKYYIKWILISVIVGALIAIVSSGVDMMVDPQTRGNMKAGVSILISAFFIQLANAAVSEEPLFRGFLWGYLENKGWKQYRILLFQAGLFGLGHIYYLPENPIYFLWTILIPIILGFLVMKSKSVGSSMIAHGMVNSLSDMIQHYTW